MIPTQIYGTNRIALCHEWFTTLGGSDLCAATIAELLEVDAIFTFTFREWLIRELLEGHEVRLAHRMGALKIAREHWQWFLPLMPHVWRSLDLSSFDVVVTSSHSCVNAVRVPDRCIHISYCYTPMRYAWDPQREASRLRGLGRAFWPAAAAYFRRADKRWAQRVDGYIAISETVATRIERFYGRQSQVVYPPVATDFFTPAPQPRDGFLAAGRLVAYKRFDIAVDTFTRLGYPLIVAGSGPDLERLRERAGPSIRFEVQPTRERLRDLYRTARALVFPGVEDFGIVPVEAQACGTPVIAQGIGGASETVVDGATGLLYTGESVTALMQAVKNFETVSFDDNRVRMNSERFAPKVFEKAFGQAVDQVLRS